MILDFDDVILPGLLLLFLLEYFNLNNRPVLKVLHKDCHICFGVGFDLVKADKYKGLSE